MAVNDLVLLILVAAGAFYAGYQLGRFKTLAERRPAAPSEPADDDSPLPGPRLDRPYSESSTAPSRPRAAPPPASAGNDGGSSWSNDDGRAAPPRRSSKPPPASAGLMGTGDDEKPDKRRN